MSASSWDPPTTGPYRSVPQRPADALRTIDQALGAALRGDRQLRAEIVALVNRRVQLSDELAAATGEAAHARSLAKRALLRANDSARAGQRADAARLTGAAGVFAMRLRDARGRVASVEEQLSACAARFQGVEAALDANEHSVEGVVAPCLGVLSGRKASRAQAAVDEALAVITASVSELVDQAERSARAAADDAQASHVAEPVTAVAPDDVEHEVDLDSVGPILDELRAELGLDGAVAPPSPPVTAQAPDAPAPADPEPVPASRSSGSSSESRSSESSSKRSATPAARH
jgi:phage shock protein A